MRMIKAALFAATLGAASAPAFAVNVNWTDWDSVGAGGQVSGVMMINGTSVGVTYSNSANSILGAQTAGGTDYWTNGFFSATRNAGTSGYTSTGPNGNDNIPTGSDIIRTVSAATHTFTFLTEVKDLYFSFVSINQNVLTFDTPIEVLSLAGRDLDGNGTDASGFWGIGDAALSSSGSNYSITATGEPHGTLFVPGAFTSLSFTTSANENWHGFTIGAASLPSQVPLPAAGVLLIAGLGAVAGLRRKRR